MPETKKCSNSNFPKEVIDTKHETHVNDGSPGVLLGGTVAYWGLVPGELSLMSGSAAAVWAVAVPRGSPGSALSGIAVFYCGTLLAFSRPVAVTALQLINLNTSTHFYNLLMFCRLDSYG